MSLKIVISASESPIVKLQSTAWPAVLRRNVNFDFSKNLCATSGVCNTILNGWTIEIILSLWDGQHRRIEVANSLVDLTNKEM